LNYKKKKFWANKNMNRIKPIDVKALNNYKLEIKFSTNEVKLFDCVPYLTGDWFSELLDNKTFNSVRVSGSTVMWPGGQDICPDCLYDNSVLVI
jgi:hypothetical protein